MSIQAVQSGAFSNVQKASSQKNVQQNNDNQRKELIDVISSAVLNPRDANDCVAVPRGIFKAYMLIQGGSGLLAIANYLPKRNKMKKTLSIAGTLMNMTSAWFFAKPFAFKSLSPTIKKGDINK